MHMKLYGHLATTWLGQTELSVRFKIKAKKYSEPRPSKHRVALDLTRDLAPRRSFSLDRRQPAWPGAEISPHFDPPNETWWDDVGTQLGYPQTGCERDSGRQQSPIKHGILPRLLLIFPTCLRPPVRSKTLPARMPMGTQRDRYARQHESCVPGLLAMAGRC
jgi:hypothetical protein